MFIKKLALPFILISSTFPALAATEISRGDTDQYLKTGMISVSGKSTAAAAIAALRDRVAATDSEFFHVSRLEIPGDGSKWSANAAMYQSR